MENNELVQAQGSAVATVEIESQRALAEVQASMILARKFPRDEQKALNRVLVACQRKGLAEAALYSFARGGTGITGPSIRLAEAMAQNWGNLQYGVRELEQRNGESTVETYCWDIETNTRASKTFQVPHTRHTKAKGNTRLTDPRDIYERVANDGARRLRACILAVIPGDVVDEAVKQCEETLKAKADLSPDALKKMVEAFTKFGVTKQMIETRIQRKIEAITAAQIVSLAKIFNSLTDGMSKPEDWFEGVVPVAAPAAATTYNIPEELMEDIRGYCNALGVKEADMNMSLGKCKGDAKKAETYRDELKRMLSDKAKQEEADKKTEGKLL